MFTLFCGPPCQLLCCLALDVLAIKVARIHRIHRKCIAVNMVLFLPPEYLIEIELPHCHIILVITFGILNDA